MTPPPFSLHECRRATYHQILSTYRCALAAIAQAEARHYITPDEARTLTGAASCAYAEQAVELYLHHLASLLDDFALKALWDAHSA